jgi:hypothetical protein
MLGDHRRPERRPRRKPSAGVRVSAKQVFSATQTITGANGRIQVRVSSRDGVSRTEIIRTGDAISASEAETISALERLVALKEKGALTESEFEAEKAKLLGG